MVAMEGLEIPAEASPAERIAAAAVTLAALDGWRRLSLAEIATEAGTTVAELARHYACRAEILDGFERMIDRRMLAGAAAGDTGDAPRDRLFDIIMERLDALQPFREGIRRIARELPFDPASAAVLALSLPRSLNWMFIGARISIASPAMPVRLAALGGAYLATFGVWLNDETQELAKTMAALDRQLDRAKRLMGGDLGTTRPAEPPPPQPAPETAAPEPEPPEPEPPKPAPKRAARKSPTGGVKRGPGRPRKVPLAQS